jgi:hypothetical protein
MAIEEVLPDDGNRRSARTVGSAAALPLAVGPTKAPVCPGGGYANSSSPCILFFIEEQAFCRERTTTLHGHPIPATTAPGRYNGEVLAERDRHPGDLLRRSALTPSSVTTITLVGTPDAPLSSA